MTSIRKIYYPDQETDDWLERVKHEIRMKTGRTVGKGRLLDEMIANFGGKIEKHLKRIDW